MTLLATLIRHVKADGFAFAPSLISDNDAEAVAYALGDPAVLPGIPLVQTLVPRTVRSAKPNVYSGNFGHSAFPLHTDLAHWSTPPRYFMLRAARGDKNVATTVFDGRRVVKEIGDSRLRRTLVRPRRAVSGRRPLLSLLDGESNGQDILRWDGLFIEPASRESRVTFELVRTFLDAIKGVSVKLQDVGDTLIVDNWRMLHGRSEIPAGSEKRAINRVYFRQLT